MPDHDLHSPHMRDYPYALAVTPTGRAIVTRQDRPLPASLARIIAQRLRAAADDLDPQRVAP